MGCLNTPDFNGWLCNIWGSGQAYETVCGAFFGATNLVFGQNPPYYLDDFKAVYPKFFGLPTALSGCGATLGSSVVTVPSTDGMDYGQFVQAWGVLPKGSVIVGIGNGEITLNTAATATNANATLQTYQSAPIPVGVVLMYLNLALASLQEARWQEMWCTAVGLYVAHFLTLYAKSDESAVFEILQESIHGEAPTGAVPGTVYTLSAQPPGGVLQSLTKNGLFQVPGAAYTLNGANITMTAATVLNDVLYATWAVQVSALSPAQLTGAQIAAQGLAGGIQTSKSVGDVSVSYQVLTALEAWGAWNLTTYGQQLVTFAQVVGMGPMLIW